MKTMSRLAGIPVGAEYPVRLMGVINVSPESFYQGSVPKTARTLARLTETLTKEGSDIIDVGAMSTAPYLKTQVSEQEEIRRIQTALRVIRRHTSCPISVDTTRAQVAQAALDAGARIINDISGLSTDEHMATVARQADGVILMAHPNWASKKKLSHPINDTKKILQAIFKKALKAGISNSKLVLDPGMGFFRHTKLPWWKWDLSILQNFRELTSLPCPLLAAVSRKSFIGHILDEKDPAKRLSGSLAATIVAVQNGATLIRTHDVAETKKALFIVERLENPL